MNILVLRVNFFGSVKYSIQMLYISDHMFTYLDRCELGLRYLIFVLDERSYDNIQRVGGESSIDFFYLISSWCYTLDGFLSFHKSFVISGII